MPNEVTYTIPLIPENVKKIEQINRIFFGEKNTTKAVEQTNQNFSFDLTLEQVKNAAKKAKSQYGESFINNVLDEFGVKKAKKHGFRLSDINEDDYQEIIYKWEAGPKEELEEEQTSDELEEEQTSDELEEELEEEQTSDELEEEQTSDELEEDDDESEVTVDAVQTALRAYAKEKSRNEAKKIMQKYGASTLGQVNNCTPAQLKAMFAELLV